MAERDIWEDYREVARLGKGKDVLLVQEKGSGKIFVRKRRRDFDPEVYRSISRIQDPHIPRIYRCQEAEGGLYVIEEYISGETLMEKMNQGYIFLEREALEIMEQLCQALECLHVRYRPIIHRDIKPSNILISSDGVVKLIDYNAARRYEEGETRDTRYMGTHGYAAPEQYGFAQSDVRTDIYAVGVVLNYMLTGCHVTEKIVFGKLGEIVEKCTQIDMENRYDSITDVKRELRNAMGKPKEDREGLWQQAGVRRGAWAWKAAAAIVGTGAAAAALVQWGMLGIKLLGK